MKKTYVIADPDGDEVKIENALGHPETHVFLTGPTFGAYLTPDDLRTLADEADKILGREPRSSAGTLTVNVEPDLSRFREAFAAGLEEIVRGIRG